MVACGGTTASDAISTTPISNPLPVITAVSPSRIDPGSGPITVTLSGSGFVASSRVQWAGRDWPTHFVNASTVTFDLPASELTGLLSRATVTVTNDAPGGGVSAPVSVSVQRAAPVIVGVTPSTIVVGDPAFRGILTVTGQQFVGASRVVIGNTVLVPTSFTGSQLMVDAGGVQALRQPGAVQVYVDNFDPLTLQSNRVTINVVAP